MNVMSAGMIRSAVSDHPRLLGVALAISLQIAAISPVSASCWGSFFGP